MTTSIVKKLCELVVRLVWSFIFREEVIVDEAASSIDEDQ